MSEVFDIMGRIGITDEVTAVLSKISGSLSNLGRQVEQINLSFAELGTEAHGDEATQHQSKTDHLKNYGDAVVDARTK
jgi:hypothetical protein